MSTRTRDDKERSGDAHLVETRIASEDVFDGKLLHVKRDTVRLPDGKTATREYIAHPGAVMIIPRLPDGKLLMERQFRYPLARIFIEFPAGKIDPGEDPAATAARELLEETGYTAERWSHIGTLHPLITYSTERIEIYTADALTFVGGPNSLIWRRCRSRGVDAFGALIPLGFVSLRAGPAVCAPCALPASKTPRPRRAPRTERPTPALKCPRLPKQPTAALVGFCLSFG